MAGTWLVATTISCERQPANAEVCSTLLGDWQAFLNPMVVTVEADEAFTFLATYSATDDAAGATTACGPAIFTGRFNATCRGADLLRGR